MFHQKSSTFIVFFSLIALCHGLFEDFNLDESDVLINSQELGRTFGSFNLSAITGGVSIDGTSILKVGLIILLFKILYALAIGPRFFGNSADRAYESIYQNRRDSYYYDDEDAESQFSSRRSDAIQEDFATLMHSLEQAFKKYSVNDIECQMYVACESAQVNRQDENGPLAKIVYDIVNSMVTRRDFSETKLTPEMDGITQAFNYGQEAEMFGKEDACSPLRTKCYELQNKKQKNF